MWRKHFRIGEPAAAPEAETGRGRILPSLGDGVRIYKQGILVHEDAKRNALWDYDLPNVSLGEDRIAHWFDVINKAERLLSALPMGLRRRALVEGREFEQAVLGDAYSLDDPEGWAEAIPEGAVVVDPQVASHFTEELAGHRLIRVPANVVKNVNKVREALPDGERHRVRMIEDVLGHRADAGRRPVKATAYERGAIRRAAKAAKWAKLDVDPEAVVVFEGGPHGILGTVDGGKIWVSRECVLRGLREVLKTLIEESAHLESSAPDKSRTMQEAPLEIIVRAIEARPRSRTYCGAIDIPGRDPVRTAGSYRDSPQESITRLTSITGFPRGTPPARERPPSTGRGTPHSLLLAHWTDGKGTIDVSRLSDGRRSPSECARADKRSTAPTRTRAEVVAKAEPPGRRGSWSKWIRALAQYSKDQ